MPQVNTDQLRACLRQAMDVQGLTDNDERAGIAGIAMGESNMSMHVETGYSHTSNDRIREVFPSLTSGLSDEQLDELKATDQSWFEFVYGPQSRTGRALGNTQAGDGYKFRGRGFIQLTGRANYQRYSDLIKQPAVMDNPDLALEPAVSALLTVAYIKDRYKGGGFSSLLRCVGNNTPDIEETKTRYYEEFKASGEFDAGKGAPAPSAPVDPVVPSTAPSMVAKVVKAVESLLPTGGSQVPLLKPLDKMSKKEVTAFQQSNADEFGLVVDGIVGPKTTTAWVHQFQRQNPPLYDDGVMGPDTATVYEKVYGVAP